MEIPFRRVLITTILCCFLSGNSHGESLLENSYYSQGLAAYIDGDFSKAKHYWSLAAEQQDARSMFNLGLLHHQKKIPDASQEVADAWYIKAGENGYAVADYYYAKLLIERDAPLNQIRVLLQRSAGAGFYPAVQALAQLNLPGDVENTNLSLFGPTKPISDEQYQAPPEKKAPEPIEVVVPTAADGFGKGVARKVFVNDVDVLDDPTLPDDSEASELNPVLTPVDVVTNVAQPQTNSSNLISAKQVLTFIEGEDSTRSGTDILSAVVGQPGSERDNSELVEQTIVESGNGKRPIGSDNEGLVEDQEKEETEGDDGIFTTTELSGRLPENIVAASNESKPEMASSSVISKTVSQTEQPQIENPSSMELQVDNYRSDIWITAQNSEHWTIQIMKFDNKARLERYIDDYNLNTIAAYFKEPNDGALVYNLIYGTYQTKLAAQHGRNSLPAVLRKNRPRVIQYKAIKEIIGGHQ